MWNTVYNENELYLISFPSFLTLERKHESNFDTFNC